MKKLTVTVVLFFRTVALLAQAPPAPETAAAQKTDPARPAGNSTTSNDQTAQPFKTDWDGFFAAAPYSRPLLSEIHAPLTRGDLGVTALLKEYNMSGDYSSDNNRDQKLFVNLDLGADIPLYAVQLSPQWHFAVSLPVSMHVFEDMFDNITAPVINTDYRFGTPDFKFMYTLSDTSNDGNFMKDIGIKNMSFNLAPMLHECTHLGDEVTIYRVEQDLPITRINVSYEYTRFQMTFNDPAGSRADWHTFRMGGIYRVSDRGYGWFSIRPNSEADFDQDLGITHSDKRFEYFFAYQWQRSSGWLASQRAVNIFSIELRNRVQYGVPQFTIKNNTVTKKDIEETSRWNINLYWGYRFYPKVSDSVHAVGLYLHFYQGINPYGQLRNIQNYRFLGLTLAYELW